MESNHHLPTILLTSRPSGLYLAPVFGQGMSHLPFFADNNKVPGVGAAVLASIRVDAFQFTRLKNLDASAASQRASS